MRLRNSDGTPIDPVPFLVAALLAVLVLVSWGPLYLMAHGIAQTPAILTSVGMTGVTCSVLYYRFVWSYNPAIREEVPAGIRYRRLLYGVVAGILLLLGLNALLYV